MGREVGSYALKKHFLRMYDRLNRSAGLEPGYDTPKQLWEGVGSPKYEVMHQFGVVELYVEHNQLKGRIVY